MDYYKNTKRNFIMHVKSQKSVKTIIFPKRPGYKGKQLFLGLFYFTIFAIKEIP